MASFIVSPEDQLAMKEFWEVMDRHRESIDAQLREQVAAIPEFAELLRQMDPAQEAQRQQRTRELQKQALVNGEWSEYLADQRAQGESYARSGISFPAWYEVVRLYRDALLNHTTDALKKDPDRLLRIVRGLDRFIDIGMSTIGDAYLQTKQHVIRSQQEAIREMSTPVLQVRDRMLILPIVGMVDTHRARQLTEQLLLRIRERRARVIIMDVTGVAIVDSKVANHLVQTVEAAKLMGAHAIVTGVSPEIAQTLVAIGAELGRVETVGDLQGGIELGERLLGLRTVSIEEA